MPQNGPVGTVRKWAGHPWNVGNEATAVDLALNTRAFIMTVNLYILTVSTVKNFLVLYCKRKKNLKKIITDTGTGVQALQNYKRNETREPHRAWVTATGRQTLKGT